MSHSLSLAQTFKSLELKLKDFLDHQALDETRREFGAYVSPESNLDDPSHLGTGHLVANCVMLYLLSRQVEKALGESFDSGFYLHRATLAADHLLKSQRPSGLIDLKSCNFDSSPDTAFIIQQFCPLLNLAGGHREHHQLWQPLRSKMEIFLKRAAPGVMTGGFHTPNHRWAICSALTQLKALFTELDVRPVVDAYLAEGIDIDPDGAFNERSIGVYDAVTIRAMIFIHELWGFKPAMDAVQRNLMLNLHMLHPDGTAETSLSVRQDRDTRIVPTGLTACYLEASFIFNEPEFLGCAEFLSEKGRHSLMDLFWISYVMQKYGQPSMTPVSPRSHFHCYFEINGLVRSRRQNISASIFRNNSRLFSLKFGAAELCALKISQSYFGVGRFISDELVAGTQGVTLVSKGTYRDRRPGYDLPLNRAVPWDQWEEMLRLRDTRPIPACESRLDITENEDGFSLGYKTIQGMDGVPVQLAFDFAKGGIWETEDIILKPQESSVVFLKQGRGRMRYGRDVIEIGPGAHAHCMWKMRDAEEAPGKVRVLLTYLTPVECQIRIRCYIQEPSVPDPGLNRKS